MIITHLKLNDETKADKSVPQFSKRDFRTRFAWGLPVWAKLHIDAIREQGITNDAIFISVSTALLPELSQEAVALKMPDGSMMPEIRVNDVLVIEPSSSPAPRDYVVVKMANKPEVIICQYKKLSYTSPDNWPNIKETESIEIEIIGKVRQNTHLY